MILNLKVKISKIYKKKCRNRPTNGEYRSKWKECGVNILQNRELGDWGEKKAVRYLKSKGYQVIKTNYRCLIGEIDIIAIDNNFLVFVEVKTRRSIAYGVPACAVNFDKQKKIRKVARHYLKSNMINKYQIRFDVISIIVKNNRGFLKHIKNAF